MKTNRKVLTGITALVALLLPLAAWSQEDDPFALEGVEEATDEQPVVEDELTVGLYYLDDDSYRYGKYTGLTDEGFDALVDFRIDRRPQWDGDSTVRWSLQGWRLGLDSRRIEFNFTDQGAQSFTADYREIPNNRFSDGMTPYRGVGSGALTLAPGWEITPGSNNTGGFIKLDESLANLKIDTLRRRMDLNYDRELGKGWNLNVDYRHETKKGERTIGSIFGNTGGNPRSVILPAPVDYATDNIEAMFEYGNRRAQFGFGAYASFFSNDQASMAWQNAFGRVNGWAESVSFPGSQGQLALEPDNTYLQVKAYGGLNLASSTRITADLSFGQMEQDELLLPFTINPNLVVHTPVPLDRLDAKIDLTMFNVRLTSQLARRLGLNLNYRYDDRDNSTPRASYPYIGADSQDQRPDEDGRINLPYSYREQNAEGILTYRLQGNVRLKAGVEYSDYSREYSEVSDADEFSWVAGVKFGAFEVTSFSLDYRDSSRDVTAYIGNVPLIQSHLPGTVGEDEWENHPLLRKYFLTDRDREEIRFRADFFPVTQVNTGFSMSYFKDDYGTGNFGLNESEVQSYTLDFGWYPVENISLVAYYTVEQYDASQSSRSFSNAATAADPNRDWFVDSDDDVDTYNLSLTFSDLGADSGWKDFDLGFDYTVSDTTSHIDVTAVTLATAPLPNLRSDLRSVSAWCSLALGDHSSLRFSVENSDLRTDDFA
ncbi:MAG TPA: MtrB/PioB family decaheme-associated outer membrane protein, partial [Xanthomonadales bacterium]|nr:MtrB/PioB family decaheme-associated outer membrane protein [Xanthomonadales bacterium]